MHARVRAPELIGQDWFNTGEVAPRLADLRGKIVLLDFWTFCCINCLHVLNELRPLEEAYPDVLVVIGVHSPKFEHEKDPAAVAAAVQRYGVAHPVLNDPELSTWSRYTVRAWPTLCVVDPEGYLVATMAGEGHGPALAALIEDLIRTHDAKGTLHRGTGPYVPPPPGDTPLRFPGKAVLAPLTGFAAGGQLPAAGGGRPAGDPAPSTGEVARSAGAAPAPAGFLVSSSAGHQIVALGPDAETVLATIGSGRRGRADGPPGDAEFAEPQGLCPLPERVAAIVGYHLVVADTGSHLLRGVRLHDGAVSTVAGTGRPWRSTVDWEPHDARSVDLSSPWDLAWYEDRVIIAMAGTHQLWWFDPVRRTAGGYAGTTVEALRDGPLREAWMAQPSGLAVAGSRLWIVDSESSALRWVEDRTMRTAVGQGLFDFGQVDGPAAEALFQHPLGVCADALGDVLVADTYNGAVRLLRDGLVSTVATGLSEPSDIVLTPDGGVVVVESAAHRLTRLAPGSLAPAQQGRYQTRRPVTPLRTGPVRLEVVFTPPPGQKLDESLGPATRLEVSSSPPGLLRSGAGTSTGLIRDLVLADGVGDGVLQVVAQVATCDAAAEHPVCRLTRQDWGVPVRLDPTGQAELSLTLAALADPDRSEITG